MCDCRAKTGLGNWASKYGGQLGDKISSTAAKKFRQFTGMGDYKVSYNSLVTGSSGAVPNLTNNGRALIVSHKEYLGDVSVHPTVVGAFNLTSYVINPGNVLTFPWVSTIALQYDQYKPLGIVFEFVTTTTDSTTNSAIGSVIMSTEYDVADALYTSKQEMLNCAYSNESKMSEDCVHGLECDPSELSRKIFFVKKAGVTSVNLDIRDYDMARFCIATQGGTLTAGTLIGSLYVHYEFAFYKEQLFAGLRAREVLHQSHRTVLAIGQTTFDPLFASLSLRSGGGDLGITCAGNVFTIPKRWAGATFVCRMKAVSSTASQTARASDGVFTYVRCTEVNTGIFDSGTHGFYAPQTGGVSWHFYCEICFQLDMTMALDATVTWPNLFPLPNTLTDTTDTIIDFEIIPSNYWQNE